MMSIVFDISYRFFASGFSPPVYACPTKYQEMDAPLQQERACGEGFQYLKATVLPRYPRYSGIE